MSIPLYPVPTDEALRRAPGIAVGVCGLVAPYLARLFAVPFQGFTWFAAYAPSVCAVVVFTAFNGIHAFVLYRLALSVGFPRAAK